MKKRIVVIGIVGIPAKYGGFETFAEYLSRFIDEQFELTVYCSSKSYKEKIKTYQKANLKYIPLKATGAQSIPYDILSVLASLKNSDVLLVLGSSGAIILPLIKLFTKKKIVFNMAGLEWKRSKWNKFASWFLKFSEKIAVKYSNITVVDNQGLQEYITSEYGVSSQVIAYGGDQVSKLELTDELIEKFQFLHEPYYAAVARIQPDNNIDMILEAFEKMPNKTLVFVGNWDVSEYGRSLKEKYSIIPNIHIIDAIYDLTILDQIRSNCVAYIHGHSSGGTNPSLLEAMHLELPIIAYDVNFNRYTTQDKAFYFANTDELVRNVQENKEKSYKICAVTMKTIAKKIYTWEYVVNEYKKGYQKDEKYRTDWYRKDGNVSSGYSKPNTRNKGKGNM